MHKRTLIAIPAILLPLTLGLAGCGGSDSDSSSASGDSSTAATETPTTTPTDEPSDSPLPSESPSESADDSASDSGSGDYTDPGAQLGIGDAASFHFKSFSTSQGDIKMTLNAIDKGSPADLKALKLGDRAAGLVPYYLRFTVVGGDGSKTLAHSGFSGADIDGLLPDGSQAQMLSVIGNWDKCGNETFPGDYGPGKSVKFCFPVLAGKGTEVVGVQYAGSKTPYDQFDGKPIVWKK